MLPNQGKPFKWFILFNLSSWLSISKPGQTDYIYDIPTRIHDSLLEGCFPSHLTFLIFQDEENINMKEQLRADVRKELSMLEMNCTDMASLLRGLGIQVGSSLQPSSQEVCFKFVLE